MLSFWIGVAVGVAGLVVLYLLVTLFTKVLDSWLSRGQRFKALEMRARQDEKMMMEKSEHIAELTITNKELAKELDQYIRYSGIEYLDWFNKQPEYIQRAICLYGK